MDTNFLFYCVIALTTTYFVVSASPDCWKDEDGNIRCVNI